MDQSRQISGQDRQKTTWNRQQKIGGRNRKKSTIHMSVSLCVLRLEVADCCPVPSLLHYSAAGHKLIRSMSTDSATQTEVESKDSGADKANTGPRSDVSHQSGGAEATFAKDIRKKHRGKREFHEIVIETHTQTGVEFGCSEFPHSKESSPPVLSDSSADKKQTRSQINFFSGNPFVEVTQGILHLFKENNMTSLTADVPRSEMICILAVPAAMTSHDLLQFTAPCCENISNVRIIRDSTPNQYMVLIKFRCQAAADEFYMTYNGTRFNSIEPDVCHLVYVAKVETTKEFDLGCLPLEGHTELPTCPVCLERMDESVDGILTILCNHSFHGSCLDKWGDTSCPVCRYCQTPEVVADNRCSECHVQESLWICLICGHVGCGRYVEGHAYNHFLETQHTYAMQLGNNRVWDYAGDNYVHRLIQNKADGKLVEFNEQTSVGHDEKLDSMQLEYTYLLTSQLESQRLYFEDKITRVEQESFAQLDELKNRTKQMIEENSELKQHLNSITREKLIQDKRTQQLTNKLSKTAMELEEERQINECLRQNQQQWQTRVKELENVMKLAMEEREKEVLDLKDQIRDLMFFLDAQDKLKNASGVSQQEIEEGQVIVGSDQSSTSTGNSSSTKHHRRKKHR